jgi:putative cell wall-binding protein
MRAKRTANRWWINVGKKMRCSSLITVLTFLLLVLTAPVAAARQGAANAPVLESDIERDALAGRTLAETHLRADEQ